MSIELRTARRSSISVATLALALVCGCGEVAPQSEPSLALHEAGATPLADPDSAPIELIGGFARTRDGHYLLADRQRGAIVVYSPSGERLRSIGRRGSGPGEWESGPFGIYPLDDTKYAVSDGGLLKVFSLDRPDDAWTRAQSPMSAAFAAGEGAVFARRIDASHRSTIARFSGPTDSAQLGGPFPSQLGRSKLVDMMLTFVAATPLGGDSVAAFTQGSDYLFVGPFAGPFDSVFVPPLTRRGAMAEVLGAVRDADPESAMRAAYKASYPSGVYRLQTAGQLALLTIDQEFKGDRMAGSLNVALVNHRSRRSCGEMRVPVETDPQPFATVAGDTLFVFSHEVDTTVTRSRPMLRKFRIESTSC